jgi:TRAP-type transport system periplasmic protein
MTRMSKIGRLVAVLMACSAVPALADRTLKLNESMGPGTPEAAALEVFKHDVEQRSNGQLKIEVHLQNMLGVVQSPFEGLATGTLDLYSGSLESYQRLLPQELSVVSLPYVFNNDEHLRRYLKSALFANAQNKLLDRGIRFISTEFNAVRGPYRVIMATRPTTGIEDLRSLKIRMDPNEVTARSWRNLGAEPVEMEWNQTYLALRHGVAQAVSVPLAQARASNFIHVAPYVTATYEYPQAWPMAISERVWNKLSGGEQTILVDAANKAGLAYARITTEAAERDAAAMIANDNAVFTSLDVEPLRRKMEPFYQELIAKGLVSREVYDTVKSLAP